MGQFSVLSYKHAENKHSLMLQDKIFPAEGLEEGQRYTVYFDDFTDIIVGIEIAE